MKESTKDQSEMCTTSLSTFVSFESFEGHSIPDSANRLSVIVILIGWKGVLIH